MTQEIKRIMEEVRDNVGLVLTGLKFEADESQLNIYRGRIQGLLEAAKIITGDEWDWKPDGIYRNNGNEPEIKWY